MNTDLLTVEAALRAVLDRCVPLPTRSLPLSMVRGRVLMEDIAATCDSPPFDKSVVDGYAVRSSDLSGADRVLVLGETILAGKIPTRTLGRREAALIMTGAPIPPGADAVVMIERTRCEDHRVYCDDSAVERGRNIMPRGREMKSGDLLLARGDVLNSARLGILASVGRTSVPVIPAPRVTIVPTGDELVEPDQVPGPGQIRNSNAVVLEGLVANAGGIPLMHAIAPDDEGLLTESLKEGLDSDVLLITGGVSAGQRDLVPETLIRLGVECVFHKVRLKPGKPLWFGVGPREGDRPRTLVFGLPGNPVSGIVGFLLFARPALEFLQGRSDHADQLPSFPLAAGFRHTGERPTFHPCKLRAGALEPLPWGGSADLRTVGQADGFAHFPAGDRVYEPGDVVGFLDLS